VVKSEEGWIDPSALNKRRRSEAHMTFHENGDQQSEVKERILITEH
jgi:hypothetical protein